MVDQSELSILCVDDEEDVVNSLFDTFMDRYNVKTVCSGKAALEILEKEDIALVISDQRMPEMEGTELLARINKIKPACKKILLTGYADINAAIESINNGAVDKYFSKPWDEEELLSAVVSLLEEYSMDLFFEKAIEDAKRLKEEAKASESVAAPYKDFVDSCYAGICLVGDDNKIRYLNSRGLGFLKWNELSQVEGREVTEVFVIDEANKQKFLDKAVKKDPSLHTVGVRTSDGETALMESSVHFGLNGDGECITGIVFQPSNGRNV